MSPWGLILLIVLVLWAMHVQHLGERRRRVEDELKRLKSAKGDLESMLVRRGRRLDVLFSAVNEVVMRVDHLGRVMAANPHAGQLFDIKRIPELPQSMLLFYRDPDWLKAFSSALKVLPESSTLPDMHVDGRVLAPRLAPLGKRQALLLCVDITDKHQMEAQRKNLFANLMHDLKTPLTSILGYARSIEAFGDDDELRKEAVAVIASESLRANEFLDALLTLEHVESFKPDQAAASDLAEVCESVIHGFSSQLDEKGVTIAWSGQESLKQVKIAQADLHRILDNLFENALRYSPEQGRIFINTFCDENVCSLEVIDQGRGVSEKELPKLTERFYRGDQARSKESDVGHGLGLAIVKELLEKYDGTLEISNHERYGLSVKLTLPVAG